MIPKFFLYIREANRLSQSDLPWNPLSTIVPAANEFLLLTNSYTSTSVSENLESSTTHKFEN